MSNPFDIFVSYWGDPLASRKPEEIAGFYRRLGQHVEGIVGQGKSLASKFLLHWLGATGEPLVIDSSTVSDVPYVRDYLANEVRPVFLGQKPVAHTHQISGLRSRLLKLPPFDNKKPEKDSNGNILMEYEGPSVGTISKLQGTRILQRHKEGKHVSEMQKRYIDIFLSLHKFGICSKVAVTVSEQTTQRLNAKVYNVTFARWESHGFDRYDWNYDLGFPVPNPDYNSEAEGAIAPKQEVIVIRHKHAKKIIEAGLARDFEIKITKWHPVDSRIIGPARLTFAGA